MRAPLETCEWYTRRRRTVEAATGLYVDPATEPNVDPATEPNAEAATEPDIEGATGGAIVHERHELDAEP